VKKIPGLAGRVRIDAPDASLTPASGAVAVAEMGPVVHRRGHGPEGFDVPYLSNVNLRAVLAILVRRAGGEVHISNEELYDAMMPAEGKAEPFIVEETPTGLRISIQESPQEPAGRR